MAPSSSGLNRRVSARGLKVDIVRDGKLEDGDVVREERVGIKKKIIKKAR